MAKIAWINNSIEAELLIKFLRSIYGEKFDSPEFWKNDRQSSEELAAYVSKKISRYWLAQKILLNGSCRYKILDSLKMDTRGKNGITEIMPTSSYPLTTKM